MAIEKIILGIDPGTTIMGFGLIKVVGKKMEFIQMNELMLQKYDDHYLKLKLIFERTVELIDTYHPDEIAIEAPFFGKNVQSMLKLGRAQGVAMAAGLSREVPITEYLPKKIKMAITGNGNASKEQVALMLKSLLDLKTLPKKPRCNRWSRSSSVSFLQFRKSGWWKKLYWLGKFREAKSFKN